MNNSVYQVRCDANNEVVVLQGETKGVPYSFDDTNLNSRDYRIGAEETARFYCTYYDQIQFHINAYVEASKPGGNTVVANQEYFEFKNSVPETYRTNYTFEKVGEDNDYYQLWAAIIGFFVTLVGWYLLLQIARIIYQYIAFGRFNWHPYRKISKDEGVV